MPLSHPIVVVVFVEYMHIWYHDLPNRVCDITVVRLNLVSSPVGKYYRGLFFKYSVGTASDMANGIRMR